MNELISILLYCLIGGYTLYRYSLKDCSCVSNQEALLFSLVWPITYAGNLWFLILEKSNKNE